MRAFLFPLCVTFAACAAPAEGGPEPARPLASPRDPEAEASPFPPAVLSGEGELHCTISAKENGRQLLVLRGGSGLEFDAVVSPIVDGTVQTKGPAEGGTYQFTSHLAQPAKGKLAGVGDVEIDTLETRVSVGMKRYQQPGGPGTELSFTSADIAARGVYIDFAGRARSALGERYAFRITLGVATEGSGKVQPADSSLNAPIYAKMVVVVAPTTTVVTTVQKLPSP
jgi:hypothetical protein